MERENTGNAGGGVAIQEEPPSNIDPPSSDRPAEPQLVPAGPIRRLAAAGIDATIVAVTWAVLTGAGVILIANQHLSGDPPEGGLMILVVVWIGLTTFVACPIWWIYSAVLESQPSAATVGKRICGIRVVDSTGHCPGPGASVMRNLPKLVLALAAAGAGVVWTTSSSQGVRLVVLILIVLLAVPALPVVFSKTGQGLHDRMTGLVVIRHVATPRGHLSEDTATSAGTRKGSAPLSTRRLPGIVSVAIIGIVAVVGVGAILLVNSRTVQCLGARSSEPSAATRAADLYDVAVDGSGVMYVTDHNRGRIERFTPSGARLAEWGSYGDCPGQFAGPSGIALDREGNVYVADTGNNRVQTLSPNGAALVQWGGVGANPGLFDRPVDVALDAGGNLYVIEVISDRIQKLSPNGQVLAAWPITDENARLTGIAIDASGNVYVSTGETSVFEKAPDPIVKLTPNGERIADWGALGQLQQRFRTHSFGQHEVYLAIDPQQNVLALDGYHVWKLAPDGRVLTDWSISQPGGSLPAPQGIGVDPTGNIYVVDGFGSRIFEFTTDGKLIGQFALR